MATETFLRIKDVKTLLGFSSDEAIYSRMRENSPRFDPDFPKSIKLGTRATAWLKSEIDAYQAKIIERSRKG
ncbi:MAG: AlpA family phage regulatory protein [Neisseria sp.]|nr:AlpA family phage regulatory protein [Neisseria sp.]